MDETQDARNTTCECCGAKIVEYRHTFNKALAVALYRLYSMGGGPINIKALSLTRNQWDNFQKLRYWGLVTKSARDDGTRIGGAWSITFAGREFIEAGISIRRRVWTYRGDTVRFDGDTCFFRDVHDVAYECRPSYAANSQPRGQA